MAHFLVTGGSGFLGAHFVFYALDKGDSVTVFDLEPPAYRSQAVGVRYVEGNTMDVSSLQPLVEEADYVLHLAGILGTAETVPDPLPSIEVNLVASVKLFELLRTYNVPKPTLVTVNGNYQWYNTYAISKEAAGRFAIMYNNEIDTRITVTRVFNAYGEWQKDRPVRKIVPEFIRCALFNEPLEVFGSGEQQFDLVYAGDIAKVFYNCLTTHHGVYDRVIEVGSSKPMSPPYLAKRIIELTNSSSEIVYVPMRLGEPENSTQCAQDMDTLKAIGYCPGTTLEEGLPRTIAWYREYFQW